MEYDLAPEFEANRPRLQSVAHHMLGSLTLAEDAVQETCLRLSRSDAGSIDSLGAWLTTVLSRVCLGMLRSRRAHHDEPLDAEAPQPGAASPEDEAVLSDTLGPALLLVLDALAPTERLAFVLHDLFAVPFEDIAPIIDRSPAAAASSPAGPGDASKAETRCPMGTGVVNKRWSRLSSQPPAMGTSKPSSACSTPTQSSGPIAPRWRRPPPTATGERLSWRPRCVAF